jgi:hypothetical protein
MTQSPTALALLLQKEHADFLEEQNTSTQKTHCAQNKVLREMQKVAEGSPEKMEFLSTNIGKVWKEIGRDKSSSLFPAMKVFKPIGIRFITI